VLIARFVAPVRLAVVRLRHRPERVLLVGLGIAAAAAGLAAMQAGTVVAQNLSVAERVHAISPESRAIRLASFSVADQSEPYVVLDRRARRALTPLLGRSPVATVLYRESTIAGAYLGLGAVDGLDRWLDLRSGRLPRPCTPSHCEVVSIRGDGRIPNVPGLRLVVVGRGDLGTTTLFGDAIAPAKSARGEASLSESFQRASRYHLPPPPPIVLAEGVAALEGLPLLQSEFRTYGWVAPISPRDVRSWSATPLVQAIEEARSSVESSSTSFELRAPIDELKDAADASTIAGRRLLLLAGQSTVLLLAFVLVAAARLRRDTAAAATRLTWLGVPRWQIGLGLVAEAALLAVAATAVGWAAGAAAGTLIARSANQPAGALLRQSILGEDGLALAIGVAGLATVALLVALTIRPVQLGTLSVSSLDVAAVAAATVAAAIILRGSADTSAILAQRGTGIALLLLPGLLAFVAAVALSRLLPAAFRTLERLTPPRAVSARLAALALVRNPAYAAVAAAFIAVSLGLALFASAYRSTLARGQHDQARFATGADFVLREDLSRLIPVRDAVSSVGLVQLGPGVKVSKVMHVSGSIGGARDVTGIAVLGLDPASMASVDGWRDDFAAQPLPTLVGRVAAGRRVELAGPLLPRRAARLSLPVVARGRALAVAGIIQARDRRFVSVELGRVPQSGSTTLAAVIPRRLQGGRLIGLRFDPPPRLIERGANAGGVASSTMDLGALRAGGQVIADFRNWRGLGGVRRRSAQQARLRVTVTDVIRTYFRAPQPTDDIPTPMLVSPRLATLAGPDGRLPLDVRGTRVIARVAAVARRFPATAQGTLSGDFAIADRDLLATALDAADPGAGETNEIWIEAPKDASRDAVARRLREPPFNALAVTEQHRLEADLRRDPLARASELMLFAATIVAVVLAFLGIALGVVAELRDERGELLDLEGQGFGPSKLRRQIRLRATAVLVFGLAGAAALGVALSLLVIAVVRVTANVTRPQPPLVLTVDWPLLLAVLSVMLAASAAFAVSVSARAFRDRAAGRPGEVGT